jgi:hypothetical protein
MTVSELRQLAKEQLQIELNSYVQVKTIEKRTEPDDTILYYVSGIRFFFFYSCLSPAKYCFRWNPNCGWGYDNVLAGWTYLSPLPIFGRRMIGKEKLKLERYLPQCHFAQYKYHMGCTGIEPGTLQWEVDICLNYGTL